jgi:hypothetical protein
MNVLRILVSIALLTLGRQLFWLFVGGVGFVSAMEITTRWAVAWPVWLSLVVALAAGVTGAILAMLLQEVAVGIAGFFAGGYVVLSFLNIVGLQTPVLVWVLALVGAIASAVLALGLFDWALIILSSLSGASLLVQTLDLNQPLTFVIYLGALLLGIVTQASLMGRSTAYQEQQSNA